MGETQFDLRETHRIGAGTRELVVSASACPALATLGFVSVGASRATAGFRWVRHDPPFGVVLACVGGRGRVLVDGGWRACAAGGTYLAPPGALHAYHAPDGEAWEVCWVIAQGRPEAPPLVAVPAPTLVELDPRGLQAAVLGLYRESIGEADPAVQRHWADLVFLHAQRAVRPRRPDDRLSRLWETVDADLARRWTVAELAALAGGGDEHLRRLCQRELGRSPMRHLTHLRMGRATYLLETTGWTIDAVAAAVGYDNPFAFSTAFRRWAGVPPSAWRATEASRQGNGWRRRADSS